ncbi:ATP-binding cassette domain-containing protein [Secundilactobacillus kimchicus]|uniref:Iron-chelate-transporting ATPase n=1 Tax=Secundilactobacillus kimchicus JCM 15530 TaxID=1302272 RepID=A0A0R1HMF4_9LACO|nr:ABC transporter ATP-binding protein [Secundilactobacillus kimchicus]KRK47957.1 iron-chelate-transporting ATPase [Secundilactobacillus kimchicus JCM 15530]MBT9671440.1 ATP-binding cassette domain-containing protein [Secundilactobacillus kimchicus]
MELKRVSYSYPGGQPLINEFTASIPETGILAIIGPNGAGKSTILNLLSGELTPTSGQVLLNGTPVSEMSTKARANQIAVVRQHNEVYDDLAVKDVVKMGRLAFHSLFSVVSDSEVAPFLEQTHLTDLADRQLSELSGGQQQRVWIAMALAQEPAVLLLDEPTTYLDIRYQVDLMNLVVQLQQEKQIAVIMVLHDMNQAFRVSHRIWLIKAGQLVKQGSPETLLDSALLSQTFDFPVRVVDVADYGRYVIQMPSGQETDNLRKLI